MAIPIDSTEAHSDWIKTRTWDLPPVQTLQQLFDMLVPRDASEDQKKEALTKFFKLPSSQALDEKIFLEATNYLGVKTMSPDLARRLGWSGSAVRLFFPELNIQYMEIKGRAQKAQYQTFEELPEEDRRFILDLETREINDPDFPLSPLKMELSEASKKFGGEGKSAVK